jgi:hypothetical protein
MDIRAPRRPLQRKLRVLACALGLPFALAASPQARAQSSPALIHVPPSSSPDALPFPDAGTIHAQGIVVPKSLRDKRAAEPREPPEPPLSLLELTNPDILDALGPFRPEVGAWVEYAITARGKHVAHLVISVLPPPMPDGRYWLEIDTISESVIPTMTRLLAHGDPFRPGNIERILISVGGQATFEVPPQSLADLGKRAAAAPAPSGAKITRTREAKVKVVAGTFSSEKISIARGKERVVFWRSDEAPLFGLVRSEAQGRITELVGSAHTGARSLIPSPVEDEAIPPDAKAPQDGLQPPPVP